MEGTLDVTLVKEDGGGSEKMGFYWLLCYLLVKSPVKKGPYKECVASE